MQKVINGIAIFSGAVALGIVGLGGYVFIRKDAIIDSGKGKIMESVMPSIPGVGGLGGSLPDLGGGVENAVPPAGTGFGIPSF